MTALPRKLDSATADDLKSFAQKVYTFSSDTVEYLRTHADAALTARVAALEAQRALDAAYYYGYSTGTAFWTATSWAAVHSIPSGGITDVFEENIERTDSAFEFDAAGTYLASVRFNANAVNTYIGFRFRDVSLGSTLALFVTPIASTMPLGFCSLFEVSAGQVLTLQYCTKDGSTATAAATGALDGETQRTGEIMIHRVA